MSDLGTKPMLTLKEAEHELHGWYERLEAAKAEYVRHEQSIGQIALDNGIDAAVQNTLRLQIAIKAAEAGVAAAEIQRNAVRQHKQAERAKQLRLDVVDLVREAEEHAAFVNEWGPKVQHAREQMTYLSQRALMMERQAEDIEYKIGLGEVATNGNEWQGR